MNNRQRQREGEARRQSLITTQAYNRKKSGKEKQRNRVISKPKITSRDEYVPQPDTLGRTRLGDGEEGQRAAHEAERSCTGAATFGEGKKRLESSRLRAIKTDSLAVEKLHGRKIRSKKKAVDFISRRTRRRTTTKIRQRKKKSLEIGSFKPQKKRNSLAIKQTNKQKIRLNKQNSAAELETDVQKKK